MRWLLSCLCLLSLLATSRAAERRESFDRDPGWDAHQNRSVRPETIHQDFGYSPDTAHAGGGKGRFVARFGQHEIVTPLDPRIKKDGATFNRFGLLPVMKQWDTAGMAWIDGNGQTVYFDDIEYTVRQEK